MAKRKRQSVHPLLRVWATQSFDTESHAQPREITREMSRLVRYPSRIYDVGRSVKMRRVGDGDYIFIVEHKRYLGRGSYALSARAEGHIRQVDGITIIDGGVRQGRMYLGLLTLMTSVVLVSFTLVLTSILFLPLALLMLAVIALHWGYLNDDRQQLTDDLLATVIASDGVVTLTQDDTNQQAETDQAARFQEFYQ